jgi:hypothetical protein
MSLYSVATVGPQETQQVVRELQGLRLNAVAGAAAGTKMNIAAMRSEDTIVAAADAAGILADDAVNCTISSSKAAGTLTVAAAVDGDTCVVNGVTYTFKNTPTSAVHVKVTAGNNTAMALALATTINSYENRRLSTGNFNNPAVIATAAAAVVTITSVAAGTGNGPVVVEAGNEITVVSTIPGAVTATLGVVAITDVTTITVNGVTFTAKTTPTDLDLHFGVKATAALQATEVARVINAYRVKYGSLDAVATVAGAVVTISPALPLSGNAIVLTGTPTRLAASGSGYLTGGSATGGFTSVTNLTGKVMLVLWFDKIP